VKDAAPTSDACPFCEFPQVSEPMAQNGTFYAKYDTYPVSAGHVLLIPRRHIASFFEMSKKERDDFFDLLLRVREAIQEGFKPDGFNIGVNIGLAAGQTVMHLHVHLIPRYFGDVEHPQGGVRRIIPNKVLYPPQMP